MVSAAVLLCLLELVARTGLLPRSDFPPPSMMLTTLVQQLGGAELWRATGSTLQGWAIGLALAVVLGVPAGMLVGSSDLLYHALRAPIEFLRPIPAVALIPLAVLIYGTGFTSKLFLVAFASFWPIFIQTLYGMRDVDPVADDTTRSFRLRRTERVRYLLLPTILPYVATGLRISSAVALILAVTSELVIGQAGLGRDINVARVSGDNVLMYALIIATGVLGYALNVVFARGQRWLLRWHPSYRSPEGVA